jgi:MerR family transcriptional regulator, mercuric resistance operon regulatory protein
MRLITTSRAENFAIGALSRMTGVNIETIRYYERIKMLPVPPRTASGRRVYGSRRDRFASPANCFPPADFAPGHRPTA